MVVEEEKGKKKGVPVRRVSTGFYDDDSPEKKGKGKGKGRGKRRLETDNSEEGEKVSW